MFRVRRNTSGQYVPVRLYSAVDHVTEMTGVTPDAVSLAKPGQAWSSLDDGDWTEVGNGAYWVRLSAVDSNTAGLSMLRVVAHGCDVAIVVVEVEHTSNQDIADALAGASEVADELLARVVDDDGAGGDEVTVEDLLVRLLADIEGRLVKSGNSVTRYKRDDATPVVTLSVADDERTRV